MLVSKLTFLDEPQTPIQGRYEQCPGYSGRKQSNMLVLYSIQNNRITRQWPPGVYMVLHPSGRELRTIWHKFSLSTVHGRCFLTCVSTGVCCWIGWVFSGHVLVPGCTLRKAAVGRAAKFLPFGLWRAMTRWSSVRGFLRLTAFLFLHRSFRLDASISHPRTTLWRA